MSTVTVTILATDTIETLPADTLALGPVAFDTIWERHFPGDEVPDEMHVVKGWAGPDDDEALFACADEMIDAAVALEHKPAGIAHVCLEGQGMDGADVWCLVDVHG